MILHQYEEGTPCPGMSCGSTDGNHSKECIAEHTAAAAGGDFVKWRPIAAAPHGKTILLYCEYSSGKGYICVGHYIQQFTEEDHSGENDNVEYCEEKDAYYIRAGWYEHQYNWSEYSSIAISDTIKNWADMPAPPVPNK
jgi:hypothetical protein